MRIPSLAFLLCVLGAIAALSGCTSHPASPLPDQGPPEDCATIGDEDGNGLADCADPACAGTVACQPVCGNGKREAGEECDDGNAIDGDGCDDNCTITACGNGVVTAGEACDDGNASNADGCDDNCTVTACGNGVVTAGEACDDGNAIDGDGCDHDCTVTACGNGIKTAGEACDDGNAIDGDGCDRNCTVTACGNGVKTAGEACDDGNATDGDGCDHNCTVTACGNGIKTAGEACDDGNAINSDGCDNTCTRSALTYVKASNTGAMDDFGYSVALSADGSTLAVSAIGEASSATGVGGNQGSNGTFDAGAVYVYARTGTTWVQQAYVKASNTGVQRQLFGYQVALSADGSTLAVGAPGEASAATGINGNQADTSAPSAGAVYVFTRTGTTWTQQAYIKASNTDAGDDFGVRVAIAADGATLAVGALGESSAATGVNGNQGNNAVPAAGAVYVFTRTGTTWTQQAYLKASNTDDDDEFGRVVALSGDGSTLAVGAAGESSGIPGDQTDNSAPGSGATYVFTRTGTAWTQRAYLKAPHPGMGDIFGDAIAISNDGTTIAVGAREESSAATGIDGDDTDNSAQGSGAVYVFTRSGATWTQQAYVKASNTDRGDEFGWSLAISADGSTLAAGAIGEASRAHGIDGDMTNNSVLEAGAVYEFTRSGTAWHQAAYVKAPNTGVGDFFGWSVALSGDGVTLAVGAEQENSSATGIDGDEEANALPEAGAAYVFH